MFVINTIYILFFLIILIFYISVRIESQVAPEKTLVYLRPEGKIEKYFSEFVVMVGILLGGGCALFWKKNVRSVHGYLGEKHFEKALNDYGETKMHEWFLKGLLSGAIKMLDYKNGVRRIFS